MIPNIMNLVSKAGLDPMKAVDRPAIEGMIKLNIIRPLLKYPFTAMMSQMELVKVGLHQVNHLTVDWSKRTRYTDQLIEWISGTKASKVILAFENMAIEHPSHEPLKMFSMFISKADFTWKACNHLG